MIKEPKLKKCLGCGERFKPLSSFAKACSIKCAQSVVEADKKRREYKAKQADAKRTRERLDRLKTTKQLIQELQPLFNKFIRLRDWGKPCISCGTPHTGRANSFDAGHYRSVGSAPNVRFDERNVHGQCKRCNQYSFDSSAYRAELVNRIGLEQVEALEADHTPRKYTSEQIRALMVHYKQKIKELERERN